MRVTLFAAVLMIACGDDSAFVDAGFADATSDVVVDSDGGADATVADAGDVDSSVDADVPDVPPDVPVDVPVDAGPTEFERVRDLLLADAMNAEELDGLLHEVAWSSQWPLTQGDQYLFLTRWDDPSGAVSWVGDFNAWAPGSDPATTLASGVHYWVILETSDDPSGSKYKWHAGSDFRAPPESTVYAYDEFGEVGMVAPPRGVSWLERFPDLTRPYRPAPRTVRVRLPADFSGVDARTLLLHDGQNVFGPDAFFGGWRVDTALDDRFPDVVAVGVDNAADRFGAYTHVADDIGSGPIGGEADDYIRLLEDDVLPFVRDRYGVSASGDSLMIAGSSLGGLVSLYVAIARPALAGCIGGMSPTTGWGAYAPGAPDTLLNRWTSVGPAVYLDHGGSATCSDPDGDGIQEDSGQEDGECTTPQLRDHLLGLGYVEGTNLHYAWTFGAPHNETAWRARVPQMLAACTASGWSPL